MGSAIGPTQRGGAIFYQKSTVLAYNVLFAKNTARDQGAGVYYASNGASVTSLLVLNRMVNCTFADNKIVATSGERGIDVYVANGSGLDSSGTVSYTHLTLPTNREV